MLRAITFGQCAFDAPGGRIAPDSELHFAILLLVVTAPPDGVARDEVLARLWPHAIGNDGRHCLRQGMYRLRQLGIPVQLNAGRIILDWARSSADVHDLLYREPARTELVRLGTLPFLPGYLPSLGKPYLDWVEELRTQASARLRRALADGASAARARGRFHEMGRLARALLELDPLNELGTIILAESLALEGSKVEALRLLEAYEAEVGQVNVNLQLPARILRRRVAEVLDDSLFLRRYEVPFVGREETFATLRGVWREVRRGKSQAAIVSGEAGIGKSRMAAELLRLAVLDGGSVLRYTTSAGDSFTPLSTLITVAAQLLTLPGALGCDQEHLQYLRRLGTTETVSAFSVAGMAADVLYAQLVRAFSEVMSAIAEEAPLVLFIDDAERLHPTTWRVLVDVWDRVGERGVLILLAARRLPEWFGSLGVRSCERLTVQLSVPPLSNSEARDFMAGWCDRHDIELEESTIDDLITTAHGNPFYLTELANHVGRGGDRERTPDNIAALISTQVRELGAVAQQILLAITVLESRGSTSRATQLLELPTAESLGALEEVDRSGLVTRGGALLRVRHQMIGEVVKTISGERVLSFTHARVAALLEREAEETDSVEFLGDCVTHWERAGETRRAFTAAMRLGHRLIGAGLGEEAERAFAKASRVASGVHQEILAAESLLLAHRLSAKWHLIGETYEHLCAIRRRESAPRSMPSELFLLALESSIWSNSPRHELSDALRFAESSTYHPLLRIRAATVSAMYADNCYDAASIRRAFDSVSDISDEMHNDADLRFLELIFHSSIGDRNCIFDLARLLADISASSNDFRVKIQGARRAASAATRATRFEFAEELLLETLALTEKLALPFQTFATLEHLFDVHLAHHDHERAMESMQLMQQFEFAADLTHLQAMKDFAAIRIAWAMRDRSLVERIDPMVFACSSESVPQTLHQMLSGDAALAMLRHSADLDRFPVQQLLELHLRSRAMGRQDFSSEVLFELLDRIGDTETARELAEQYVLAFRREVNVPPAAIVSFIRASGSSAGGRESSRRTRGFPGRMGDSRTLES